MGGYLRLSDLGRPLQDDLDKDTKKNDLVSKILKKKNSRKCLWKKGFATGKVTGTVLLGAGGKKREQHQMRR